MHCQMYVENFGQLILNPLANITGEAAPAANAGGETLY